MVRERQQNHVPMSAFRTDWTNKRGLLAGEHEIDIVPRDLLLVAACESTPRLAASHRVSPPLIGQAEPLHCCWKAFLGQTLTQTLMGGAAAHYMLPLPNQRGA